MKNIIYFIFFTVGLASCEKTIQNFEIPAKPKKIVINGLAVSDRIITINLSQSLSFYDRLEYFAIENGSLNLQLNGSKYCDFEHKGNGWYISNIATPVQPNSFELTVNAPNFESVKTRFSLPKKPEITKIESEVIEDGPIDCNDCPSGYYLVSQITFKDDPLTENNYLIEVLHNSQFTEYHYFDDYGNPIDPINSVTQTPWIYQSRNLSMISSNLAIEVSNGWGYQIVTPQNEAQGGQFFLSDAYFSGQEYTINIKTNLGEIPYTIDSINSPGALISIQLSAIDKQYFDYAKNMALIEENRYNPLAEPVTPIQLVENGFGIVISKNIAVDTINLLEIAPELIDLEQPYYDEYY